jgi:pimeloyl-ACP methyl ester carboxylesterase
MPRVSFHLVFAMLVAGVGSTAALAAPAPCVRAGPECVQWIDLGHGARSKVYATLPLDQSNPGVRRALVIVHGALRNADHYFATANAAAFLADAHRDTIVIAPDFASADGECHDPLAPGEVSWSCGANTWKSGGPAVGVPGLTSFDFMDAILRRLADRRLFPNLAVIVVAGHSAGGQFVTRYEMANLIDGSLGVAVRYVVANPSSYAWPDATRPTPTGGADPATASHAWASETPGADYAFGPFDAARAPDYDRWPYGLEARSDGAAARFSADQLKHNLASRPTTYLLGQVDVLPLGGFDSSPEAMAQGPTRRARGEAFVKHIVETLGAHPSLMIVPECGHNDRCIYTTDAVLPVIFPPDNPPDEHR